MDVTIDPEILKEIDRLRGREKRSTFVEHLLRVGLESCQADNHASDPVETRKSEGGLK